MTRRQKAKRKTWHKKPEDRATCPTCGKVGSGMYAKWVLNEQKVRYEPYYYFAHPWSKEGGKGLNWCYVRKLLAVKILHDPKLREKYGIAEVKKEK